MSLRHNSKIVTDGLVLSLDAGNIKSFRGEPTTNLLPSPSINSYPTFGNEWGTYNTNMYCDPVGSYGCGTYWSMGTTISSVSNNIVYTTSTHPFRTYDVLRPQTSGGGVSAATDYIIKRISSTSFTLHPYNGSQDGSQGYINMTTGNHKVFDDFSNDTRISVNSTNFPTMWSGAPHLPNSGIVKEIITGGFKSIDGLQTDCIRLHYVRDDNICDGMAYGPTPTVTPGTNHTVSFYSRSVTPSAVGKSISYQIYNYGAYSPVGYGLSYTLGPLGVWERQTLVFNPVNEYCISYWFGSSGKYKHDIANIQFEAKPYATHFIAGVRGATVATGGGWKDLSGKGNHGTLINNITYDSNNLGSLVFNDSNYVNVPNSTGLNLTSIGTVSVWFYHVSDTSESFGGLVSKDIGGGSGEQSYYIVWTAAYGNVIRAGIHTSSGANNAVHGSLPANKTWCNYVLTWDGNNVMLYKNGVYESGTPQTINCQILSCDVTIGRAFGGYYFQGKISNTQIYNKSLSSSEILQNYNAIRGRYGI